MPSTRISALTSPAPVARLCAPQRELRHAAGGMGAVAPGIFGGRPSNLGSPAYRLHTWNSDCVLVCSTTSTCCCNEQLLYLCLKVLLRSDTTIQEDASCSNPGAVNQGRLFLRDLSLRHPYFVSPACERKQHVTIRAGLRWAAHNPAHHSSSALNFWRPPGTSRFALAQLLDRERSFPFWRCGLRIHTTYRHIMI